VGPGRRQPDQTARIGRALIAMAAGLMRKVLGDRQLRLRAVDFDAKCHPCSYYIKLTNYEASANVFDQSQNLYCSNIMKIIKSISILDKRGRQDLDVAQVNIILGPNNTGKSSFLREVYSFFSPESLGTKNVVQDIGLIDNIIDFARNRDWQQFLTSSDGLQIPYRTLQGGQGSVGIQLDQAIKIAKIGHLTEICSHLLCDRAMILNGISRLNLANSCNMSDLQSSYQPDALPRLIKDENIYAKFRDLVHQNFGLHISIDPTGMNLLRLKLSEDLPPVGNALSIGPKNQEYFKKARSLENESDGIKSFIGILLSLHAFDCDLMFIDEPEAFLYPPLARNLSQILAKAAVDQDKSIFIVTHSPNVLIGFLESEASTNIWRFSRHSNSFFVDPISREGIQKFSRSPKFRNSDILEAAFFEGLVLCEGDDDRVFFEENFKNQRKISSGVPNLRFIRSFGKEEIHVFVRGLQELKMPVAAVLDNDAISGTMETWPKLLDAFKIFGATREMIQAGCEKLRSYRSSLGAAEYHRLLLLPKSEVHTANQDVINLAGRYGLFIIESGALESLVDGFQNLPKRIWLSNVLDDIEKSSFAGARTHYERADRLVSKIVTWHREQLRAQTQGKGSPPTASEGKPTPAAPPASS
jgi:hypothetical protein